ncbi:MAG: hypothetical protein LBT56_08805 [Prevotellaceae bacterium]|jgi:TolA-binding protein|nr:hypothetical protein [Prevotellaceae bacterium]
MAIISRDILKSWFKKGLKPLESQFANWIDSFFHKNDKIPINSIDNLINELNNKYDKLSGENIELENQNIHQKINDEEAARLFDVENLQESINQINDTISNISDIDEMEEITESEINELII